MLRQVVDVMRQGKATLVAPQGMLLTTQEAADFLGISRPTLVKLLEDGAIPFERSRNRIATAESACKTWSTSRPGSEANGE
ncbi:MAG: excisionase family DNA-binding protein [Acidimicrobiales bacterium]